MTAAGIQDTTREGDGGRRWVRALLIALFFAGCAVLVYRGPARALRTDGGGDFAIIYSAARAWLLGENPYDVTAATLAWLDAAAPGTPPPGFTTLGSPVFLYPPSMFPLMSPIAVLPWRAATWVWAGMSLLMWIAAALASARLAGLRRGTTEWWGLMAGAAWLAPAATNMFVGQLALVTVGLVAMGRAAAEGNGQAGSQKARGALCGLLQGAASALKPQIAAGFLAYDAGRGRWGRAACGAAVVALTLALGIWRMDAAHVPWRQQWIQNLRDFTTTSNGDPTRANPGFNFQIISLHYPLHALTDNREVVRAAVWAIVAGLCAAYLLVDWRRGRARGEGRGELISVSMVAVVSLIAVYHRFYDAALLLFPLTLAVRGIARRGLIRWSWVLLGLVAVYFVPGTAVLWGAARAGRVPSAIAESWVWRVVLLPHEAWALLGMAVVLLQIRLRAGAVTRKST